MWHQKQARKVVPERPTCSSKRSTRPRKRDSRLPQPPACRLQLQRPAKAARGRAYVTRRLTGRTRRGRAPARRSTAPCRPARPGPPTPARTPPATNGSRTHVPRSVITQFTHQKSTASTVSTQPAHASLDAACKRKCNGSRTGSMPHGWRPRHPPWLSRACPCRTHPVHARGRARLGSQNHGWPAVSFHVAGVPHAPRARLAAPPSGRWGCPSSSTPPSGLRAPCRCVSSVPGTLPQPGNQSHARLRPQAKEPPKKLRPVSAARGTGDGGRRLGRSCLLHHTHGGLTCCCAFVQALPNDRQQCAGGGEGNTAKKGKCKPHAARDALRRFRPRDDDLQRVGN